VLVRGMGCGLLLFIGLVVGGLGLLCLLLGLVAGYSGMAGNWNWLVD